MTENGKKTVDNIKVFGALPTDCISNDLLIAMLHA